MKKLLLWVFIIGVLCVSNTFRGGDVRETDDGQQITYTSEGDFR